MPPRPVTIDVTREILLESIFEDLDALEDSELPYEDRCLLQAMCKDKIKRLKRVQ